MIAFCKFAPQKALLSGKDHTRHLIIQLEIPSWSSLIILSFFFFNFMIFWPKLGHWFLILFYSFDIMWVSYIQPWPVLHRRSVSLQPGQIWTRLQQILSSWMMCSGLSFWRGSIRVYLWLGKKNEYPVCAFPCFPILGMSIIFMVQIPTCWNK